MQMEGLPENNTVLIAGKIVKGCVFSHEVYGEGLIHFRFLLNASVIRSIFCLSPFPNG